MKTVSGVPFPESVFLIVGCFLIRDLFTILSRRFWALIMPSDERKGTRFKKERNQKRGQSQARKRTRTYIYIYIYRKKERGQEGGQVGELGRVEPLRWHMPGDERGDCQGGRENNSGRRVKLKTVSGVPFPESVFFNCFF